MPLLKEFRYHSPATVGEALKTAGKSKEPLLLAGGTFALNYLKKSPRCPSDVIGLKKIQALTGIKDSKEGVSVGAMTTITELLDSAIIKKIFFSLNQACSRIATTPIRNMATIGGNCCSRFYWVDLPAVLASLGAKAVVATLAKKQTVGLLDFLSSKPSKKLLLTHIILPEKDLWSRYFRHTRTMEVDIPFLGLAFACRRKNSRCADVRIIVNTTTSLPLELKHTQKLFEAEAPGRINPAKLRECLDADTKGTRLDEYRLQCLEADFKELIGFLKEGRI